MRGMLFIVIIEQNSALPTCSDVDAKGIACIGSADIGIHQRARWFMHMPLACAIMIRSPSDKTKKPPNGDFLFWQRNSVLIQCTTFDRWCNFRKN